jgi:hypothetical protein
VQIPRGTIEKLAKAWLAEAKRIQSNATCDCGCEQKISVTRFKPGHDAKLLSRYRKDIQSILADSR